MKSDSNGRACEEEREAKSCPSLCANIDNVMFVGESSFLIRAHIFNSGKNGPSFNHKRSDSFERTFLLSLKQARCFLDARSGRFTGGHDKVHSRF